MPQIKASARKPASHCGLIIELMAASYDDLKQTFDDLNHTGATFLLTDIEVGLTFLDLAQASRIEETVLRNHQNARVAYDTVLGFLSTLTLVAADRSAIETRLEVLKTRLVTVGQEF